MQLASLQRCLQAEPVPDVAGAEELAEAVLQRLLSATVSLALDVPVYVSGRLETRQVQAKRSDWCRAVGVWLSRAASLLEQQRAFLATWLNRRLHAIPVPCLGCLRPKSWARGWRWQMWTADTWPAWLPAARACWRARRRKVSSNQFETLIDLPSLCTNACGRLPRAPGSVPPNKPCCPACSWD